MPEIKLTPIEALENLDKVAAVATTNREGHDILKESIRVLRELILKSQP